MYDINVNLLKIADVIKASRMTKIAVEAFD